MMLQHWPTEVMVLPGLFKRDSQVDGTDQDSQNPRQAFVVIMKATQSGIVTRRVWPKIRNHLKSILKLLK